ncbi:hypothetical protein MIZ03_0435 [Rhodoferax lithotrophicus]|uniref:Uncharacterized protein n=2 Tax=Rhodoferax lithotrophicus TaxID=2798804 RepID=A0ABM7MHE0_9BURK|nr:hypothetical protein MIZ03_0435 [Rhodoferax sp. MIZ03]
MCRMILKFPNAGMAWVRDMTDRLDNDGVAPAPRMDVFVQKMCGGMDRRFPDPQTDPEVM